jgi:hypothetical protein
MKFEPFALVAPLPALHQRSLIDMHLLLGYQQLSKEI